MKMSASKPPPVSPDEALLKRLHGALERWERTGAGPTSSLSGGGAIAELESQLARLCDAKYAVAVASGTIALRAAAAAVGVGRDTNVIVPALDWPAATTAVMSLGAQPRPADCGAASILIDAGAVRELIDESTRAVVVTHLAGMPADMDALVEVAAEFDIPVIEDASQAVGAIHRGRPIGALGTVGAFSLGPGKLVDAGEGGVVVTNDEAVYAAAIRATQHPARHARAGLDSTPAFALAARIHPAAAFLGLCAFEELPAELARRGEYAREIRTRASDLHIGIPYEGNGTRFSWSCVPALVDQSTFAHLAEAGLGATALGITDIACDLRTGTHTPNADNLLPLCHRLYLRQPS